MELQLEQGLQSAATALDRVRSGILKVTLAPPALRGVFISRSQRLLVLFSVSSLLSLGLSVYFPLWVLALGPMIYGVPHLVTSVRFFHYTVADPSAVQDACTRRRAFCSVALIMGLVIAYRLTVNLRIFDVSVPVLSEWRGSTYLEFFALLLTFCAGTWIYRKPPGRTLQGALLLLPLALCFWFEPWWTIGALVLIHNFVAFAYWRLSARSASERAVASGAGALVFIVTLLIFAGWFDPAYALLKPAAELRFANLRYSEIGRLIAPWSQDPSLCFHAAVAYAFGQMMHYFVWLKAIPDQHHHNEMPTSFRQSLRLLEDDFGRRGAIWTLSLVALSALIWIFCSFPFARMIYFALAGYHGYLEIAGLALARRQSLKLGAGPSGAPCR